MKLGNDTLVLKRPDFKNTDLCSDDKLLLANHSSLHQHCWKSWDSFFLVLISLLAIMPSPAFPLPTPPTISARLCHQRISTPISCFLILYLNISQVCRKASGSKHMLQNTNENSETLFTEEQKIRKLDSKCWWACGEVGNLMCDWWGCRLVRSVWKGIKQSLVELSNYCRSQTLGKFSRVNQKVFIKMFITAWSVVAKNQGIIRLNVDYTAVTTNELSIHLITWVNIIFVV